MIKIKISKDFSPTLGGRYRENGPWSGEEFRDDLLIGKVYEALHKREPLFIDFDDCYGIGTAWLDEAFTGIVTKYGISFLNDILGIKSDDDETLEEYVRSRLQSAEDSLWLYTNIYAGYWSAISLQDKDEE